MLLLLCFVFLLGSPTAGLGNPLPELSSRDEVVQMAGYGEEKLSTVLVTGSVNCEARFHGGTDQPNAWPMPGALVAVNLEKICRVKIQGIPKGSQCRQAHVKRQKGLGVLSFGNGIRTYSAGNIRFQHSTSSAIALTACRWDKGA